MLLHTTLPIKMTELPSNVRDIALTCFSSQQMPSDRRYPATSRVILCHLLLTNYSMSIISKTLQRQKIFTPFSGSSQKPQKNHELLSRHGSPFASMLVLNRRSDMNQIQKVGSLDHRGTQYHFLASLSMKRQNFFEVLQVFPPQHKRVRFLLLVFISGFRVSSGC